MQPHELIEALQKTNSRNEKERLLQEHGTDQFYRGCNLALDPHKTYHIQQLPKGTNGPGITHEELEQLLQTLHTRKATGNEAKELIEITKDKATKPQWDNWIKRIIQKDLKCGITEKTINKIIKNHPDYKKHTINTFECQLANDSKNHTKHMNGKKIIEIKLDGVRAIAIITKNGTTLHSRNGKILNNFPHINQALQNHPNIQETLKTLPEEEGIVIDGEIMSKTFQDLMKQLYRKEDINATDSTYHTFDTLPLTHFKKGHSPTPLTQRIQTLKTLLQNPHPSIKTLKQTIIDLDTPEGQEELTDQATQAEQNGYEGIMIKDPQSPYECKRTTTWLKMKPVIEVSLEIINYIPGENKYQGTLGAFQCKGEEDGKTIEVNVGGGYTDEQRNLYWQHKEELIGRIMEVKADAITQNQDGTYSLRFPRIKTIRGFEKHEKI